MRTIGKVELRGNTVLYTPNSNLQLNGSVDRFTYETNGGTATVTVFIGPPGSGQATGNVTIVNNTAYSVDFRVISSDPTDVFVDCLNIRPVTFINATPMTTVTTVQPFTGNPPLCVTLSGGGVTGSFVRFEATATGVTPSVCNNAPSLVVATNCFVNPSPGGVTITFDPIFADCTTVGGTTVTNQLTGLQLTCVAN